MNFQVSYRLEVIRIHLRSFESVLDSSLARILWNCLLVDPVFVEDRDIAFNWFCELFKAKLVAPMDEDFFNATFLQLDPSLLTDAGVEWMVECFISAFTPEMIASGQFASGDSVVSVPGLNYLWKVLLSGESSVSEK